MSFAETFINNYGASTTGMTDASYINKVYLGTEKIKREKVMSPTGVEYKTAAGTKDRVETIAQAKIRYLTDENLRTRWNAILRQNGLDADPLQARAIWDMAVEGASDWYSTSNGQQKVTPEQYVTWYARGTTKKKKPSLPTRQVYATTPEQIDADINEIVVAKGGRTVTDADKAADWYKDLAKVIDNLYSKGILTEVKEIVNPETGVKEKVVTQTPGFSKEQITEKIETAFAEADPASIERKKNLDMANWAFQKMGRRG